MGEREGFVFVHADEAVEDATISFDARLAIGLVHIALAVGLQQGVGKHGGTGRFEVVGFLLRSIHHLIPHTRFLVLPFHDGFQILA